MIIYTCIFQDYDTLKEPLVITKDWKYILYTDNPNLKSENWEIRVVPLIGSPQRTARIYKLTHYQMLADRTIWIDASFEINCDLNEFWDKHFVGGITVPQHPYRNCPYKEMNACIVNRRDSPDIIRRQNRFYRSQRIRHESGMIQSGILLRERTEAVKAFCDMWLSEVRKWSVRDQIGWAYPNFIFPDVTHRFDFDYRTSQEFIYKGHAKKRVANRVERLPRVQPEHTEVINTLIKDHELFSYLEIGVRRKEDNFNLIRCERKTGVDPDPNSRATFIMTSDEFFAQNTKKYDLIFIDGLHEETQVDRDIENSLNSLTETGFIVIHDVYPTDEIHAAYPRIKSGTWQGTTWKSAFKLNERDGVDFYTLPFDSGILILWKSDKKGKKIPFELNWQNYLLYRTEYLKVKP